MRINKLETKLETRLEKVETQLEKLETRLKEQGIERANSDARIFNARVDRLNWPIHPIQVRQPVSNQWISHSQFPATLDAIFKLGQHACGEFDASWAKKSNSEAKSMYIA